MDIWDGDKLILFIAFVMPGFISLKVYNLISYGNKLKSADSIVDAVAYSSINYAILFIPIWLIETSNIKKECSIVLFLCPLCFSNNLGIAMALSKKKRLVPK